MISPDKLIINENNKHDTLYLKYFNVSKEKKKIILVNINYL